MTSAPTAFIGIDVAKETLMLATWQGRRPWQRPNTPTGWQAIIADLSAHAHPLIVLEATGPYHQGLVRALADAGQTPVVLNPVLSKRFVQSRGQKAKTDRVDAVQLAAYAAQVQPRPRPVPSRAVQTLQMLVSYRADLQRTHQSPQSPRQCASSLYPALPRPSARRAGSSPNPDRDRNAALCCGRCGVGGAASDTALGARDWPGYRHHAAGQSRRTGDPWSQAPGCLGRDCPVCQ